MRTSYVGDNDGRLLSGGVWGDCPVEDLIMGLRPGRFFFDDFQTYRPATTPTAEANWDCEKYKAFTSTGGYLTQESDKDGAVKIGSDDDNESAGFRGRAMWKIIRGGGDVWFEARVKKSNITDTKFGVFVGLREDTAITNGVPIATAGTIADENLVGFHALEGDGDQFDTIYKANGVTQVTVKADAITLVADTYVKLGMHYNDRNRILTFFKDGVALDDTKTIPSAAGTDFPNDVDLCMTFVTMMAAGSTPGYPVIDWWGCAQAIV